MINFRDVNIFVDVKSKNARKTSKNINNLLTLTMTAKFLPMIARQKILDIEHLNFDSGNTY